MLSFRQKLKPAHGVRVSHTDNPRRSGTSNDPPASLSL